MQVQWYPGHMHKAFREIREALPEVDVFLEILDARIPYSSQNPVLAELRANRPCLHVLNKADLADDVLTSEWISALSRAGNSDSVAVCKDDAKAVTALLDRCRALVDKPRQPGRITILVSGIPNVGKSTLINLLAARAVARTGNEPAVTRGVQRIRLDSGIQLLDTPGVLWPNIEHPHSGFRLATCAAVRDTALNYIDVAEHMAAHMLNVHAHRLRERYDLEEIPGNADQLLEAVGRARGALLKGGQVDIERAARIFVTDLRDGSLGKLTLETPADAAREQEELLAIREQKEAAKAARKAARKSRHKN